MLDEKKVKDQELNQEEELSDDDLDSVTGGTAVKRVVDQSIKYISK